MQQWTKWQYFSVLILTAIWIYAIHDITAHDKQWDFKTYYYAAVAHERGLDAYDTSVSQQLAGTPVKLSYVYPPLTLWFFRAFTLMDFKVAYATFLLLKLALLIALLMLWRRFVFENTFRPTFLWFTTLVFSSCIYWDFVAGNIGLIEQSLFWVAMWALLDRRMPLFVGLIVAISCFKLTFIVFLLLPLLWKQRGAAKHAIIGFTLFALYLAANYVLADAATHRFIEIVGAVDERGESYNHSLLAMIRDTFDQLAEGNITPKLPDILSYLLYAISGLTIVIVGWRSLQAFGTFGDERTKVETLFLFSLTYVLAMPRMKSYSYIILIPAAYYIIRRCVKPEAFVWLFGILVLTKWTPLPLAGFVRILWWHYPWLIAFVLWVLFLRYLADGRQVTKPISP